MLAKFGLFAIFLVLGTSAFDAKPEESSPRRARFSSNSPSDVARCLNGALAVGCGTFACLENSTCDTDGMHNICQLFLHTAATFNTQRERARERAQGKTFVKESLRCIANGVTSKVFQTIRHCGIFQRMISEVLEECYSRLDISGVARSNPEAIGEVVQVPAHFPNRYYSTLLQSLLACDQETVAVVRMGFVSRLGPDMETFFQLLQNKPCPQDSNQGANSAPASWQWPMGSPPSFKIQPSMRGRDPTQLFARKHSDREME